MHIREIHMKNVMSHADTTLELPDQGIVLVEGDNGAGKSSLIEAVPAALWGKTLRGTPAWREGEVGLVQVETDQLTVERTRKGNKGGLSFTNGGAPKKFDTVTKAQPELDQHIPTYDTWRRTQVFSSADAHHFSLAPDAERKRLLEQFLGLDRFEQALKDCRSELKQARVKSDQAQERLNTAESRLIAAEARLDELKGSADSELPPEPDEKDRAKLKEAFASLSQEISAARRAQQALNRQTGSLDADIRAARAKVKRLSKEECEACGQDIPPEMHAEQREAAEKELAKLRTEQAKLDLDETTGGEDIEDLQEELQEVQEALGQLNRARSAYNEAKARHDRVQARREELLEAVEKYEDKVDELLAPAKAAAALVRELEACERALGMKGVRAQILGSALGGIQEVCNAWLARVFPGVHITLKAQGDRADGKGTVERITLAVDGLDHPYGYKGASQGERRRVDVALLLALAEIAAGAAGAETGTLMFDEVFDALDENGIDAMRGVLAEIAEDRAVLVITHTKELAERLVAEGCDRYRVDSGKLTAV